MTLSINDIAPDFTAASTEGPLHFHKWAGDNWVLFFSHPKDFTPVCTTELGAVARLKPEFDKRGIKVLGLSVDPVGNHEKWGVDIAETQGTAPNFPMIGDTDLKVSKLYGMLPADTEGTSEGRTPANNATVRNVFIIGPDKRIKTILVYPMSVGRNFQEILRIIDSMQLAARHPIATPSDWKQGEDVIISGSVNDDEAAKRFPGYKTHKPYLRTTTQPTYAARIDEKARSDPGFLLLSLLRFSRRSDAIERVAAHHLAVRAIFLRLHHQDIGPVDIMDGDAGDAGIGVDQAKLLRAFFFGGTKPAQAVVGLSVQYAGRI